MEASGRIKLAGAGAMAYFLPEAIDSWRDQIEKNHVTEVSRSLRSRAKEILEITRKLRDQFNTIEESLRKLSRIKYVIEKENWTRDEKKELIAYARNSFNTEFQQFFEDESNNLFNLLVLVNNIYKKLKEEMDKKVKKDRKRKEIELVFLAHGSIVDSMIPASSLLPLPSITDVLLYSPWNCLLYPEAAYSIATGSIQPHHRQFGCTNPDLCPFLPAAHTSFRLPHSWNSMSNTGLQSVPIIMVSPVAKVGDPAFAAFIALAAHFGEPAANRYLIPYLAPWIGKVPFFIVTLAMSLVLFFSGYEATVHLAACLGKSPGNAVMQEEYLQWQYAYAVDNTGLTVPRESIRYIDGPVFNMFKAVFGDESPFF